MQVLEKLEVVMVKSLQFEMQSTESLSSFKKIKVGKQTGLTKTNSGLYIFRGVGVLNLFLSNERLSKSTEKNIFLTHFTLNQ